jgi:peptide/nickel transport system ATP-binding protein
LQRPLLSIENLTIDFGKAPNLTRAAEGITFTVNRGEIVAVVGESGSGKSVTALSLLRLLPSNSTHYPAGKINFSADGVNAADLVTLPLEAMRKIRGAAISMIFQEPMSSLNPVFTCGNQLIESIRVHQQLSKADARLKAIELFNKVQLPDAENLLNRYPHQISGGQKQRVMIAMAICNNPALLIADEPTTALDVTVQQNILQLLTNLQAQTNMGLLFITHDLGLVRDFAQKIVVMYRGKIVEQNNVAALFQHPQHPYTKALLACRPALHAKGKPLPVVSDFWQPEGVDLPAVLPVANSAPLVSEKDAVLLKIDQLKIWFPARKNLLGRALGFTKAVDDLSFTVNEGEILGIVGESGCGKTTLGRAILQLVPATSGSIFYNGIDLLKMSKKEQQLLRKELQIVFQDPYGSLNPRLQIGEAISEAMQVHGIGNSTQNRKELVVELLEKVSLKADHYRRYPFAFSGGQRQRIGIARALALQPRCILFDESVSALDVSVQAQVLNLINDLKKEYGFTALFITHDLAVVRYISDRILVMKAGRLEEIGEANQVFSAPQSAYTRTLLHAIPGNHPPAN